VDEGPPPAAPGAPLPAFVAAFLGAVVGVALVLFAYDRFVVQPRAAAQAARAELDLAERRVDAQGIAAGLDASVDRSVDRARSALGALAGDQDKARLANEALQRGAMYRVALSEYYMSRAQWPADAAEAGLPAFDAASGGVVGDITLGGQGVVTIALRAPFAPGSRFVLTPTARNDGTLDWRCHGEGDADLPRLVPACAP
jgi:type IV pilus assembly protein PilA